MFKNILIGLFLISTTAFAYLYNTEHELVGELNDRELINIEAKSTVDSLNSVLTEANFNYEVAQAEYITAIGIVKWQKKQIQLKHDELLRGLKGISNDSVAKYIVDNYLGDKYKIIKIQDELYTALEPITARDIVKRDIAFKAHKELFKAQTNEIEVRDTLIRQQAITISITTTTNTELIKEAMKSIEKLSACRAENAVLATDLDKQTTLKWYGFGTAGVFLLFLILL